MCSIRLATAPGWVADSPGLRLPAGPWHQLDGLSGDLWPVLSEDPEMRLLRSVAYT